MFQTYLDSTNVTRDSQPVLHALTTVEKARDVDAPSVTYNCQHSSPRIASLPNQDHPGFVDTTSTTNAGDMETDTVGTSNNSWTDGSGGDKTDNDDSDESDEDDMEVCIFYDLEDLLHCRQLRVRLQV